jgi:dihydrofolate reductase
MLWTMHYLTLDGVMADPHLWHPTYAGDDAYDLTRAHIEEADTLLLGRRTYDEFASWWPGQGDGTPIARATNAIPKFVVTSRPAGLGWGPVTDAGPDPLAAARSARGTAGSVMVAGSGQLVRALLAAGLVDEMRLTVDPLVRGHGLRLLPDGVPALALELVDQRALANGVQYLAYRPAAAAAAVPGEGA